MELVLHGVRGPYAGRSAALKRSEITIGRDPTSNIPLIDDPQLSRSHVKLFSAAGNWHAVDLGSTNGTFLNGNRIGPSPVPLINGAVIEIGSSSFRVELVAVPAQVSAPPPSLAVPPPTTFSAPAKRPWGLALKEALKTYEHGIQAVMRDGVITMDEIGELKKVQDRLGLTDSDTFEMRARAFISIVDFAIQSKRDDLASANEELVSALGLAGIGHPGVFSACARSVAHYSMQLIERGQLPIHYNPTLNLDYDEVCHVEVAASLLEERVVSSGWVSGHSGVSFRIAKGVRFHVGGTRGHRTSERAVVPVSVGCLAVTSKRIAFLGNPKSFEAKWPKVMGLEPYMDGLTVFITNRVKAPTVQYEFPELADVVAAVCSVYVS